MKYVDFQIIPIIFVLWTLPNEELLFRVKGWRSIVVNK